MSLCPAHVIGGKLQTLHVHGVVGRGAADLLRRRLHAVGEQVAETLPVRHLVQQLHHGHVVAEGEWLAPGLRLRQQALLGEFHGEADGHARRHRVEAQLVAETVGGDDRIHVAHACGGAQRVEGLELGAFGHEAGIGPGAWRA